MLSFNQRIIAIKKAETDAEKELSEEDIITLESVLVACKMIGLNISELEYMTIGGLVDFVTEYVEAHNKDNVTTRQATQSDFDNF